MQERLVAQLNTTKKYFDTSTGCLLEEHSGEAPAEGMFTVAEQVAHVAQTIDWFVAGASSPEGFDMNFEAHAAEVKKVSSLADARAWLDKACAAAVAYIESSTMEELSEPTAGDLMGGMPRMGIVSGIVEHTSHHRGALTVYSRVLGLTPAMPYM